MIVVDTSVLANALTDDGPVGRTSRAELARDLHWAAPPHLVVETFSVVLGLCLGSRINERRSLDAIDALTSATIEILSIVPLLPRMWELRENVTGYDAAYVAAAETHDCPLLTADGRLTRVGGLRCDIRLVVPADD